MKSTFSIFFPLIFLSVSLTGCNLFDVSLVEYLEAGSSGEGPSGDGGSSGGGSSGGDGPPGGGTESWVYLAVSTGNNANSGLTETEAVKHFSKALDIWAARGSTEAWIMLTENIAVSSNYNDPQTLTATGLVDFSTNPVIPSGITAIILAGSGGGITIDNAGQPSRRVLYLTTAGKTITLRNLTITGGRGNPGGGIYIGGGGKVIMESGVIITGNEAGQQGGGVYVDGVGSTFTMKGGEIRGNKAADASSGKGGGVCVGSNGTFVMEGGTIGKNESGNDGGG
ncbi:MAG: hypothetical protein LBP32_00455, partial [Spirochaetaceae bacterium]|nr:hypothetical protein [Spirochaetaceae bacterium]